MRRTPVILTVLLIFLVLSASAQQVPKANLALSARATASSAAEDSKPENLTDGDTAHTQWTAKDGTSPADTWAELTWPSAVQFQEVVIRQASNPKLTHVDLQACDTDGRWRLLKSMGDSQHLLPRLILAQFPAETVSCLRLANFAGQVSINEVEVYDRNDPPVIELGSDLLNHIFGIVTDGFGTRPFANTPVHVQGTAGSKTWQASTTTDKEGVFQVDMPVGLTGTVTAVAEISAGLSAKRSVQANDLTPGLSLPAEGAAQVDLDGEWRFKPDPDPDFFQPKYSDGDWKQIKVPAHWTMEGFNSQSGIGGYRKQLQIPASFRGRRIKLLFDGVYSGAEVWLNGTRVGSHEGGFAPFELDITGAAYIGADNLLAVRVREDTLSSHLDDMSHYANFPLAGIFRPVRIFILPDVHVRRFHVRTIFDSSYKNATLALD
ncbi:MAG TPA: hypothetical protein VE866_11850, partial [Candidatus Binatia bacterium]|nr:hypothetical protein [Candidatus Binatia bacterium]